MMLWHQNILTPLQVLANLKNPYTPSTLGLGIAHPYLVIKSIFIHKVYFLSLTYLGPLNGQATN